MARYTRILSIDGGGLRGLIPAEILVRVEQKIQEKTANPNARIADYFDLFAGTSAGGILTCLYLSPDLKNPEKPRCSAQEVLYFYRHQSRLIFTQTFWQSLLNFGGFINEKYSSKNFMEVMSQFFGELTLQNLLKPCLITAYETDRRKAHFFTQHDAKISPICDFKIVDVLRSTSAAPTFFEAAKIQSLTQESYTFVDGGVFANNPALCAYAEARHKFNRYMDIDHRYEDGPTAERMVVLSLGTGDVKRKYEYEQIRNWGKIQWVSPLFDIIMTGVAETVNYQIQQIFDAIKRPNQYLRINPLLLNKKTLPIDDVSETNLVAISELGQSMAEEYDQKLDDFVELLLV